MPTLNPHPPHTQNTPIVGVMTGLQQIVLGQILKF